MPTYQPANLAERRSLRAVQAERYAQQSQRGHSDEADDDLPLHSLIERARDAATIASENLRGSIPSANPQTAWRKAVQSAALMLAALDRLERALGDSLPAEQVTVDLFSGQQPQGGPSK